MFRIATLVLVFFLGACGSNVEPVAAPQNTVVKPEEKKPVAFQLDCNAPPPSRCCFESTPECNACRANYERYIRGCPDAVDARAAVPVTKDIEWIRSPQPKEEGVEEETDAAVDGVSSGVHFKASGEAKGRTSIPCDELEETLCCESDSPDCIACRQQAKQIIRHCRDSGEGEIKISHSPMMPVNKGKTMGQPSMKAPQRLD
jgi:hypothetical protein